MPSKSSTDQSKSMSFSFPSDSDSEDGPRRRITKRRVIKKPTSTFLVTTYRILEVE